VLWHNPFEGLTLTDWAAQKKLWTRRPEAKVRLQRIGKEGRSLVLEGRHLMVLEASGAPAADDWFQTDPHDLALSEDGSLLALVRQFQGGLVRLPS